MNLIVRSFLVVVLLRSIGRRFDCAFGADCLDGWLRIGNFCYLYMTDRRTSINDAIVQCGLKKSRLPTFDSSTEYQLFEQYSSTTYTEDRLSLGLRLEIRDYTSIWTWITNGKTISFSFWDAQAIGDGSNCAVLSAGVWQKVRCDVSTGVMPVCQQLAETGNWSEIPCSPVYRFSGGWQHLLTTNGFDAVSRGFDVNETDILNGTLYAANYHLEGTTQPLYEMINPSSAHSGMVWNDADLQRLLNVNRFTLRAISVFAISAAGVTNTVQRYLTWSTDPFGDTMVSDYSEHNKLAVQWSWKDTGVLYLFSRQSSPGRCAIQRSCVLSEWGEWNACSATCGVGATVRNRSVIVEPMGNLQCDHLIDERNCSIAECVPEVDQEILDSLDRAGILDTLGDRLSASSTFANRLPAYFVEYLDQGYVEFGHLMNDTVSYCEYSNTPCGSSSWFKQILNRFMGNCFTFNPEVNGLISTRSGPNGGLRLLLSVQQMEYLCVTETVGFKLYLHDSQEYPFVETYGLNIAPGTVTSLTITMSETLKIHTDRNPCSDSPHDPHHPRIHYHYDGIYSVEGCLRSCIQDFVVSQCGCADPRYAKADNVSYCDLNVTRCPDFYQNVTCVNDYLKAAKCACVAPCRSSYYDAVISTTVLNSNHEVLSRLCDVTASVNCSEFTFKDYALLEIYYTRLQKTLYREASSSDLDKLLNDVSNAPGNLNGFCMITLFEFLLLGIELLALFCIGTQAERLQQSEVSFFRSLANQTKMTDFLCFVFTFCGSLLCLVYLYSSNLIEIHNL